MPAPLEAGSETADGGTVPASASFVKELDDV
jgi:hypothetical protein